MFVRRLIAPDSVAITGSVVGLLSLPFGWLTLKPNRLTSGTNLNLWDSYGWGFAAVLIALWLVSLIFSLYGKSRRHIAATGIISNLIVILTFLLAGLNSSRLLESEASFTRISLGAGFWISAVGAYILIFSCRQRLKGSLLWQNAVSWSGIAAVAIMLGTGWLNDLSVVRELSEQQTQFTQELIKHVIIFATSVIIGTLIGIPLGIRAARSRHAEKPIFFISNILQTIPSLALFGLLIAPLSALSFAFPILREWGISGIGAAPAIIALILYSLLPIVRNTYIGLNHLDPAVINAGAGMGMTRSQIFRKIEVPLSAPLVLEGIRTASVQAVSNTAVAALIGAGGLGYFIFQGITQAADDVVIMGALPIMALALLVDTVMRLVVNVSTPKGLRAK